MPELNPVLKQKNKEFPISRKDISLEGLKKLVTSLLDGWEPENDYQEGYHNAMETIEEYLNTGEWPD